MSYVECIEALRATGGAVNALRMTLAEWDVLQRTYKVGELLMPCCRGVAVPKVSPNGHQFFAHASGACSESEESQWHQAAKHAVRATLETLGCVATVEEPGKGLAGRWQADVWGERKTSGSLSRSNTPTNTCATTAIVRRSIGRLESARCGSCARIACSRC